MKSRTQLFAIIIKITALWLISSSASLHATDSIWTKTFGGTNIDVGHAVQQTNDNGFIITGYTRSFGTASGRNVWLIKTDQHGNELWNKTYGGNSDDEGTSVMKTADGGYIVTGYTSSFGAGSKDVYLIRTDTQGNELWSKTFGGSSDEEGYSVGQLPDGGFIIAGATSSFGAGSRDGWLIRTNTSGNTIWTKTLGGLSTDGARSVNLTSDGGFIITGWTASDGAGALGKAWLVKTDSLGNSIFNRNFGGTSADRGYWVQQTSDGGYIMTGYTASSGAGLDDMLLVKTDGNGNQTWLKTFGGTGRDYGHSIQQTVDGGFLIAGYTLSYGAGGDDVWLVKTDSSGIMEWNKTFGGTASDVAYCVVLTSDGGYAVTGHTLSYGAGVHDVWLIKYSPQVIPVELTQFYGSLKNGDVILHWVTATEINNSGFEIQKRIRDEYKTIAFVKGAGTSVHQNVYTYSDLLLVDEFLQYRLKQIDFNGSIHFSQTIEIESDIPGDYLLEQNYPNPFNPTTNIVYTIPVSSKVILEVYDPLGRIITTLVNEVKSAGRHEAMFSSEGLANGIYFYRIAAGSFTRTGKMTLLK